VCVAELCALVLRCKLADVRPFYCLKDVLLREADPPVVTDPRAHTPRWAAIVGRRAVLIPNGSDEVSMGSPYRQDGVPRTLALARIQDVRPGATEERAVPRRSQRLGRHGQEMAGLSVSTEARSDCRQRFSAL